MAQVTALQPYGVPGLTRTFVAKPAAVLLISATITAVSGLSGIAMRAGVASGVDEPVRNEFQFPHIPDSVPDDIKRILLEMKMLLEGQTIGDSHVGGAIDIDGDIHTRGILSR